MIANVSKELLYDEIAQNLDNLISNYINICYRNNERKFVLEIMK